MFSDGNRTASLIGGSFIPDGVIHQTGESLLIADEDLAYAAARVHDAFYDDDNLYGVGDIDDIDESITKSYNQKLKDDTNYLAKQRDMYDEDSEMSKKRNNAYQERKDADILYNL